MDANIKIANVDAGYRKVCNLLMKSGETILDIVPINEGRYIIVKTDKENYLVAYKRELFLSFGRLLKSKGASGIGDSLNRIDLKYAISKGVRKLISIFPSGNVYSISVEEFLNKSILWTNKEGKEVYSTSIHNFQRMNQE